jgi:ubiquinone biosynthesis protein COQ9
MNDADQDTTTMTNSQLAAIAFDMLADKPLDQISLDDVADVAGIDRAYAAMCAGTVASLILHHITMLDNKAMLETFDDLKDAGEVSIREKILEAILHRFEIYNPHKNVMASLGKYALRNPPFGLELLAKRVATTRRLLFMCGDNPHGWRGEARIHGVVGVIVASARVWQKDDSPDLSMTMKEIDKRLEQAEEWGQSFGVVGRGASRNNSDQDSSNGHNMADHDMSADNETGHDRS